MTGVISRRPGRPRFVPTLKQRRVVISLRSQGYTFGTMAKQVGVSIPTLKRAFAQELLVYDPKLAMKVALLLLDKALKGKAGPGNLWIQRWVAEQERFRTEEMRLEEAARIAALPPRVVVVTLTLGDPEVCERVSKAFEEQKQEPFRLRIRRGMSAVRIYPPE